MTTEHDERLVIGLRKVAHGLATRRSIRDLEQTSAPPETPRSAGLGSLRSWWTRVTER